MTHEQKSTRAYYEALYDVPPHLPVVVRKLFVAFYMLKHKGVVFTVYSIYKRILTRIHMNFIDVKIDKKLKYTALNNEKLEGMNLKNKGDAQNLEEIFYAPTYYKTCMWSLQALKIKYSDFTVIDCGSGLSYALYAIAQFPFKAIIGVEFAQELYERGALNVNHFINQDNILCKDIKVLHQDILEYDIPNVPLVVYVCNPFNADIMKPWIDALVASYLKSPRDIIVVYSNPVLSSLFKNHPNVAQYPISLWKNLTLKVASPFDVNFYYIKG